MIRTLNTAQLLFLNVILKYETKQSEKLVVTNNKCIRFYKG